MKDLFKICIVLLALSGKIYSQNWLWVKPLGVSLSSYNTSNFRLSSSGNLITFLTENGGSHLIFTNADGDVLWSNYTSGLIIKDICVDASDNVYFSGHFTGTISIQGYSYISNGSTDAIIGRFKGNGQLQQIKTFGTISAEYANSLALDNNYDILVTGAFVKPQTVGTVSLTGNNSTFNTYLIRFDKNLVALNGIETISHDGCSGTKVAVDQNNSIYLLGTSIYTLSIGTQTTYISEDGYYLSKLNFNLIPVWLNAICTHYMYGTFLPSVDFDINGNIILNHQTGGGGGSDYHLQIQKYTTNGNYLWGRDINMTAPGFLSMDNTDNIWVAGRYSWYTGDWFSILKINSTSTTGTQLFYDQNIKHGVYGLAVKAENDFYIIGNCNIGSALNGYTCSPSNSVFMARYGSSATAVEPLKQNNLFSIYPNPAYGTFMVNSFTDMIDCLICIKNTLGQTVHTSSLKELKNNSGKEIDISSQPKGIYFVELRSGNDRRVEKIVVQ
jgi:hypothetical protein